MMEQSAGKSSCAWPAAPDDPGLFKRMRFSPGEAHAWCAWLDSPELDGHSLRLALSADELERAESYHFEKDRRRFIARRGILRVLLGRYLEIEPALLRFSYSRYGKPALADPASPYPLCFNLSHSSGLALYVFTHNQAAGIDVERMDTDFDCEAIAERFFSPHEQESLLSLPREQRPLAFFTGWTRKEAYIKAQGQGLSLPLDQFDVSLVPGEAARLLAAHHDAAQAQNWSLQGLEPAPGYVAALAVAGRIEKLYCWQTSSTLFCQQEK